MEPSPGEVLPCGSGKLPCPLRPNVPVTPHKHCAPKTLWISVESSILHQHYWSSVVTLALASEERQPAEEDSAEIMVWEYLAEPPQPHQSVLFHYWARKLVIWPELSNVAMDCLSIPPTSIQSEHVFSHLGDILRPCHSRLDPITVERLSFIKVNLPFLGSPPLNPKR